MVTPQYSPVLRLLPEAGPTKLPAYFRSTPTESDPIHTCSHTFTQHKEKAPNGTLLPLDATYSRSLAFTHKPPEPTENPCVGGSSPPLTILLTSPPAERGLVVLDRRSRSVHAADQHTRNGPRDVGRHTNRYARATLSVLSPQSSHWHGPPAHDPKRESRRSECGTRRGSGQSRQ